MKAALWRGGLLLVAIALNGCALIAPQVTEPDQAAWAERQAAYSAIQQWTLRARMATAVLGWSGSLQWQQQGPQLQLNVSGPLGIGGFRAEGTVAWVEVITSDQQRLQGDPEILFHEVVGWPFPLRHMRYWARGLTVPDLPATPLLDNGGRLRELQQAGWHLRYTEYKRYGDYEFPRRMLLDNGELTIRIVIDDWQNIGLAAS